MKKRPSYKHAIEWIGLNDDAGSPHSLLLYEVETMISVSLIADIFGISYREVANDVVNFRLRNIYRKKDL